MATNTTLQFRKVASMPTSGLQVGAIYFDKATGTINIATSATAYDKFGYGVKDAEWKNQILTLTKSNGTSITLDFTDVASQSAFSALKTAFETEQGKVSTLQSEMAQAKTDISTNATNIGTNATAIADEASRADAAEKKIAQDLANEITNRGVAEKAITDAATALTERVDGHNTEIANLWTQVGATDAAGLRKKVKDLEGTVGSGTTGLVGTAADHETRIDAIEASIGNGGDLEKRIDAVETLAGNNKTATEKNASDISGHATRIQTLEDAVKDGGTLEVRVDNIENLIAASGDSDNVINKVSEVITWFEGVSEGKAGATLLADVAELKDTTVPAVSAQADKGVANAATAQSGVNAINEKLGTDFSKDSTVSAQLAAVKTKADNALPAATYNTYVSETATTLSNLDTAVKAAKSQADKGVADAATADGKAVTAQNRADAAYTLADGKVSSVTASGAGYLTLSATEGKTPAISGSLTVQAVADATSSKKGLAEAYDVKSYVDNKVSTSITAALTWEEFN